MSLRTKIILILSCVVGLYAVFDNGVLRFMASKSFEAWEREEAGKSLDHVVDQIEDEVAALEGVCRMWARWPSVARFASTGDPASLDGELGPKALAHAEVDLLYVIDGDGRVLWGRIEAPGADEAIHLREFPGGSLGPSHPLRSYLRREGPVDEAAGSEVALLGADDSVSGLMMTAEGALLVSSYAIDVPSPTGSASPRLLMGRFFDDELRHAIGDRATVQLQIENLDELGAGERPGDLLAEITSSRGVVHRVGEDGLLHLYRTYEDVRRRPSILLTASVEREITARGRRAVNYALLSTVATALLILLALLRLLQGIVIRPLSQLTDHAVEVGRTDDTSLRFGTEREDEVGILATEFDRMLGRLAASREEVVQTARKAGMSEIATGVLHNVGNVLNSVNVSANLVTKKAEQLAVRDLERMVEILKAHEHDLGEFVTNDPKGKHMLSFLAQLSTNLSSQQANMRDELRALGDGIDHIADLVRSQQTYAGTKGVFEMASVSKQVEQAVKMCNQAYGKFDHVEVVCDFQDVPNVPTDKHKLMEILVNLIQNARQALMESGQSKKRIVLRVRSVDERAVAIDVEDNGSGIAPENLDRIFNHGFTTKPDGHGFGLHVSANAATEMGASLRAQSEGPGAGATFTLELPVRTLEAAHAA